MISHTLGTASAVDPDNGLHLGPWENAGENEAFVRAITFRWHSCFFHDLDRPRPIEVLAADAEFDFGINLFGKERLFFHFSPFFGIIVSVNCGF